LALREDTDIAVIKVQEYVSEIFPEHSENDWAELREIAGLTALRRDSDGEFYISNFWRGPMLYSLVRALKPASILELGTGRGYGAFCMAKALVDGGIDGELITVDRTPGDEAYVWAYVNKAQGNEIVSISLNDFWSKHLPEKLNDRIEFRCGDTASTHKILADQKQKFDLVFIDGDHSYYGVALDFLSAHSISARNAVFVFDDYSAASGYGIRKLINRELSHYYSVKIIDMELTAAHDISVDHMMAICNGERTEADVRFTQPADLRFRYLLFRRWFRNRMISVKRQIKRR
jgi:predicted O-methyltransferase YrrM